MKIDTRFKIIYLLIIAVGCFLIENVYLLIALFLLQILLWLWLRLSFLELGRIFRRLAIFIIFILFSYLFIPASSESLVIKWLIPLNISALLTGLIMSLRVFIVITASMLVRLSSTSEEFVESLKKLKVPEFISLAIDSTLALIATSLPKKEKNKVEKKKFDIKKILKGDIGFLIDLIGDALSRSKEYVESSGYKGSLSKVKDLGIISGIVVLMMTTKFLKILPGIPIFPAHKGLLIIPLYFLAYELTETAWGATLTGITIGVVSFLFGEGTFGIFEIFKYIAPGLVIDGLMPPLKKISGNPSVIIFSIMGLLASLARLTTIVLTALLVKAPPVFYVLLTPTIIGHFVFGILSGPVSYFLVRRLAHV